MSNFFKTIQVKEVRIKQNMSKIKIQLTMKIYMQRVAHVIKPSWEIYKDDRKEKKRK